MLSQSKEVIMWKQVVGYEDYYEVSDTGEIRSVDRVIVDSTGKSRLLRGKIMKQSESMSRKELVLGTLLLIFINIINLLYVQYID